MQLTYMLTMAASIATAAAMPSLQKRALACPASNNTVYTTLNGNQYTIECGLDRTGSNLAMSYVNSLENCLLACSLNILCVDVSFTPGAIVGPCYMKSAINTATVASSVMGARLGTGSLTASTSSVSSTSTTASSSTSVSTSAQVAVAATTSSSTQSSTSITAPSSTSSSTSVQAAVAATTSSSTSVQVAAAATTSSSTTAISSAQSSTATSASGNVVSSVVSAAGAVATGAQVCGASISAIAEYPHMVIRVSKNNPLVGYPEAWNGTMNSDIDSIFNFDIKSSYAGKSCTLFFMPPSSDQLNTAGFPWGYSGIGGILVSKLSSWVTAGVAMTGLPFQTPVGAVTSLNSGSNTVIYSQLCPAGDRMSFRFTTTGTLALDYYQYTLPYSVGVYMSVC